MSRGLGALERQVLATLREHGELCFQDLCPRELGKSKERSMRRVLASLSRKGLISGDLVLDDVPGRPVVWRYTGPPG